MDGVLILRLVLLHGKIEHFARQKARRACKNLHGWWSFIFPNWDVDFTKKLAVMPARSASQLGEKLQLISSDWNTVPPNVVQQMMREFQISADALVAFLLFIVRKFFTSTTRVVNFHHLEWLPHFGVDSLVFSSSFDRSISSSDWPSTLTSLRFGRDFNQSIDGWPPHLLRLRFGRKFNRRPQCPWPPHLTHLRFGANFNWPLDASGLPFTLTHLRLGANYKQPLRKLPPGLQELRLDSLPVPLSALPPTLRRLILPSLYSLPLILPDNLIDLEWTPPKSWQMDDSRLLPADSVSWDIPRESVLRIIFPSSFNQPFENRWSKLLMVKFGEAFDQPLDRLLAPHLTHLFLGLDFNQPVDYLLPPTLSVLVFGVESDEEDYDVWVPTVAKTRDSLFNQPVDGLPSGLTILIVGSAFDQPVDHLPPALKQLSLGQMFNQPLDHLPAALQRLRLGNQFAQFVDHLPSGLLHLSIYSHIFNCPLDHLPGGLQVLILDFVNFCQPLDHLPPTLERLHLKNTRSYVGYSHPLHHLPATLQFLHLEPPAADQPLDHLPDGLRQLRCVEDFPGWQHILPLDHLPTSLMFLDLALSRMNNPLDYLPPHLTHLKLGDDFNQPLDHLPPSLIYLSFGNESDFDQPIDHLPPALQHLSLAQNFKQPIDHLPSSLTSLLLSDLSHPLRHLPVNLHLLELSGRQCMTHPALFPSCLALLTVMGDYVHQLALPSLLFEERTNYEISIMFQNHRHFDPHFPMLTQHHDDATFPST